MSTMFVEK